jgi:hypothetical protein
MVYYAGKSALIEERPARTTLVLSCIPIVHMENKYDCTGS